MKEGPRVEKRGLNREMQPRRLRESQIAGGGEVNALCTHGFSSPERGGGRPHQVHLPPFTPTLPIPERLLS